MTSDPPPESESGSSDGDATHGGQCPAGLPGHQRLFTAVFEDPNMLVGILDPDGTLRHVNHTALEYIDAPREDVIGSLFWETPWWSTDARPTIRQWIERAAAGEFVGFDADLSRPNGELYSVEGTVRPVKDDDDAIAALIISSRDVTERARRDRHLRVVDRMLRHNLNNSMNVILGFARRLADRTTGQTASEAGMIVEAGETLLEMAQKQRHIIDVLSQPLDRTAVDLTTAIQRPVQELRRTYPEARIRVNSPETLSARAIPQIDRAVGELVENAIIHADTESPRVTVTAEATSGGPEIRVEDVGDGLPETERAILEGDTSCTQLAHSQGMGLWLVRWILTRSGGTISVDILEKTGSRVTLSLPHPPTADGSNDSSSGDIS